MGIAVLLIVGIAVTIGLVTMPTVIDVAGAFNVAVDTPLYDIVQLLPIAFFGLIIVGALWAASRM